MIWIVPAISHPSIFVPHCCQFCSLLGGDSHFPYYHFHCNAILAALGQSIVGFPEERFPSGDHQASNGSLHNPLFRGGKTDPEE